MVTVQEVRDYGQRLQDTVEAINYNLTVIDDSQMVKSLSEISPENKHLIYLVIPDNNNTGADDSNLKNNEMQFIVLQKTEHKIAHNDFLNVIHNTQATARAVELQMRQDKYEAQNAYDEQEPHVCGFMMWLDTASIRMMPMWDYAGCHGWSLMFTMKTYI